ncbi:hypothetical protein QZH41_009727, partial [Actinostola sp. cb2023]
DTNNALSDFERTKPGKGAQTSDYYRVNNIPDRFNNPDSFHGYQANSANPMYMTSNEAY